MVKISTIDAPAVALGPARLTFVSQSVSTASGPQAVRLTDAGSSALSITSIAASGDFTQTNSCGSALTAGVSCTISVTFTPTATGVRTGELTINDDAAGSPHQVSLSGNGNLKSDSEWNEPFDGNADRHNHCEFGSAACRATSHDFPGPQPTRCAAGAPIIFEFGDVGNSAVA